MAQKVLLISPPFVQLNTPYPATSYLKGYLNTLDIESQQVDLGIEVILQLFSYKGLELLFSELAKNQKNCSDNAQRIVASKHIYIATIDAVIHFLQNNNPTLAHRICTRNYLPEANRFSQIADLDWAFGQMGTHDKARHLATLYLEDLSDLIVEMVDPNFGFSRYAEHIAMAAATFNPLYEALLQPNSFIDHILLQLLKEKVEAYLPTVVGLSVPFPGNLYSALKCGQWLKAVHPEIKIVMGGGYPNTELRSLTDPRAFQFVDYITLDDGEVPLRQLLEYFNGERSESDLKRTYLMHNGTVYYSNASAEPDVAQRNLGIPDYSGLPLKSYLSVIETPNPMHRLWSDGRWNKLTLAHGCYWGRCAFCDTSLDYIKRFEPLTASIICDRMEQLMVQTGETGFHFVDEAAPPALLKSLALEIIKRKLNITWWTNIRFEKNFTRDLCYLLSQSGCIAISGGLEVASDRLLGLINKGVSVAQVAKVANHFTQTGILVHAYLMYGFPTQTAQESVDSLEIVRQLFEAGVIHSGFWHHFALTAHSPVGLQPETFQIEIGNTKLGAFANNELECVDRKGTQHELFSEGLRKSLFNYMHGIGIEFPLQRWFDFKVPKTTHSPNHIKAILVSADFVAPSPSARIVWLENNPSLTVFTKSKKGHVFQNAELTFRFKNNYERLIFDEAEGLWLANILQELHIESDKQINFDQLRDSFDQSTKGDFILFWNSKNMQKLRAHGLIVL